MKLQKFINFEPIFQKTFLLNWKFKVENYTTYMVFRVDKAKNSFTMLFGIWY